MVRITPDLVSRCHEVFLRCDEFKDNESLYPLFITDNLREYKYRLPECNNIEQRTKRILEFLAWEFTIDGKSIFMEFLEMLMELREKKERIFLELEEIHKEFSQLYPQTKKIILPFVIAAMESNDAKNLIDGNIFESKEIAPIERDRFIQLYECIKEQDLDINKSYQNKRDDWIPFISQESLTIELIIRGVLTKINMSSEQLIIPQFISDKFFSNNPDERKQARIILKKSPGIIIADSVSLHHPDIRQKVVHYSQDDNIAIIVLSPVNSLKTPINIAVEKLIEKQMEAVFLRFDNDYDQLCELHVGDIRSFRRWLYSILPIEAELVNDHKINPHNKNFWGYTPPEVRDLWVES
jgi:hypothetical protein